MRRLPAPRRPRDRRVPRPPERLPPRRARLRGAARLARAARRLPTRSTTCRRRRAATSSSSSRSSGSRSRSSAPAPTGRGSSPRTASRTSPAPERSTRGRGRKLVHLGEEDATPASRNLVPRFRHPLGGWGFGMGPSERAQAPARSRSTGSFDVGEQMRVEVDGHRLELGDSVPQPQLPGWRAAARAPEETSIARPAAAPSAAPPRHDTPRPRLRSAAASSSGQSTRHDDRDRVRRRAQPRHDPGERRTHGCAVVEQRKRKLEAIHLLADREPLLADLSEQPPPPRRPASRRRAARAPSASRTACSLRRRAGSPAIRCSLSTSSVLLGYAEQTWQSHGEPRTVGRLRLSIIATGFAPILRHVNRLESETSSVPDDHRPAKWYEILK